MRILLDESVPVQVRNAFDAHHVSTAVEMGCGGLSNGELLNRAEADGFELLIVADKQFHPLFLVANASEMRRSSNSSSVSDAQSAPSIARMVTGPAVGVMSWQSCRCPNGARYLLALACSLYRRNIDA